MSNYLTAPKVLSEVRLGEGRVGRLVMSTFLCPQYDVYIQFEFQQFAVGQCGVLQNMQTHRKGNRCCEKLMRK
jgi:hypothetical protein